MRALRLYYIGLSAAGHRLRHDLGREVAVAVSALVLMATFLYVFNDFLNVQVASLSGPMRDRFAEAATLTVLALAAGAAARAVRAERADEQSVRSMAANLGETPGVVRVYLMLHDVTVVAATHGVAWWLTLRYLHTMRLGTGCTAEAALLAATVALAAAPARRGRPGKAATEQRLDFDAAPTLRAGCERGGRLGSRLRSGILPPKRRRAEGAAGGGLRLPDHGRQPPAAMTPVAALIRWRVAQLVGRSRLTRLCLALAVPFLLAGGLAAWRGAPLFVAATAALAAGYLGAASLCFQLAEDLRHGWAERGFGVTHEQFQQAYGWLGLGVGLAIGGMAATLTLLGQLAAPAAAAAAPSLWAMLAAAAKVLVLGALPPTLMPLLMLQIDGRRAAVNLLLTLIASLFVGTAVLAHWLGLLLVPLLRYYALRSQAGRFYRA